MTVLDALAQAPLRAVDLQFARLLARYAVHDADAVALAAALASTALARGEVCVDLEACAGRPLGGLAEQGAALDATALRTALLSECGVCTAPSAPARLPLVLDGTRLYLGRYWRMEARVAAHLAARAARAVPVPSDTAARLARLFADDSTGHAGQKRACAIAATRALGIVTGGPGTGKTTTVARLLVLLAGARRGEERDFIVRLAAPTGKAAARAQEALSRERAALERTGLLEDVPDGVFPEGASTLHRLLGASLDGRFRHHAANPIAADVVVLDECSMVDLRLFDALLDALSPSTQLILLGDRDQLDAVEPGNVFGALCEGAERCSPLRAAELAALGVEPHPIDASAGVLHDATAVLRHNFRFDARGGIGRLAQRVNNGDVEAAAALLASGEAGLAMLACTDVPPAAALAQGYRPLLRALVDGAPDTELLDTLERFRVLCALRAGPWGVAGLNQAIERALLAEGLIDPRHAFYAGRILLVTRNDHALGLYNGDLGLVVPGVEGREQVLFRGAAGTTRRLPPGRLPEHETAFAMTIHKSQGSESDRVCIVLPPPGVAADFGGREMLYTAITRARDALTLVLPGGVLEPRWFERAARVSGLAARLHDTRED